MNWEEYGSFEVQSDGFPNCGEVVRAFRLKNGYSYESLGKALGVTGKRVKQMEQNNNVPLNRRQTLIKLLGIPPVLMGIATLEDMNNSPVVHTTLVNNNIDLDIHRSALPLLWEAYHAGSNNIKIVGHVNKVINALRGTRDAGAYGLLSGYYRLISRVYRDKIEYALALSAIKHSEKYASMAQDNYMLASALLTHGRTLIEVGHVDAAINRLTSVYNVTSDDDTGIHGTASIELAMALARQDTKDVRRIKRLVDESYTSSELLKDDKSFTALNDGVLSLYSIDIALQTGSKQSIDDYVQGATEKMPAHHTYRHSLLDVYQSQWALKRGDYYQSLASAQSAYESASAIDSRYQLAILKNITNDLRGTKIKNDTDLQELIIRLPKKTGVVTL